MGKAVPVVNGRFVRTVSLMAHLLDAVTVFKSKRMEGEHNISIQLMKFNNLLDFIFDLFQSSGRALFRANCTDTKESYSDKLETV